MFVVRLPGKRDVGAGGKTRGNIPGRTGSVSLIRSYLVSFQFLTWHTC